jgi:HEAT repeat protein
MEKGSPIRPGDVRAILIEIGPSSASAIGDALEGIDLSKVAFIILVEVLGEFGGLTSVPALIVALGNPDPDVQAKAIEAIGKLDPAIGPALARHLTRPVEQLSKRQKKNLAEALGKHGSPESIPIMQQAQRSERDAETIAALATAIEQISRNPRTDTPAQAPIARASSQQASNRDTRPTENVSIHVSATATATATATVESTEDAKEAPTGEDADKKVQRAKDLAEEGRKLREEGKDDEALEKYRQAYALHSIRFYLLIIFELEGDPLARASEDTSSTPDHPEIEAPKKVLLSEIYSELDRAEPDLGPYSGSFGLWSGTADEGDPISRDGRQDLYIVRGESGQDFIAAVGRNKLRADDLGSSRTWRGALQGFRIIKDGEETRMLPVLLVDKIE